MIRLYEIWEINNFSDAIVFTLMYHDHSSVKRCITLKKKKNYFKKFLQIINAINKFFLKKLIFILLKKLIKLLKVFITYYFFFLKNYFHFFLIKIDALYIY